MPVPVYDAFLGFHPLNVPVHASTLQVFNFDPLAPVTPGGAGVGPASEEDMTKLCNHRRKAVAMATLYRSMETTCSHSSPGEFFCHFREECEDLRDWRVDGG